MKDFNYYRNVGVYPVKPRKPYLVSNCNAAQAREFADEMDEYDVKMQYYGTKRNSYYQRENDLIEEFRKDLMEEFGLTNHPKVLEIYAYVWDKGHSDGFEEVYNILSKMEHLFN